MISALVSLVLSVAASHGSAFNKMPNRSIMTSDSVFVLYLHTCVVLCDQSYFTFRHLNVHLHEYRLNKYDYKMTIFVGISSSYLPKRRICFSSERYNSYVTSHLMLIVPQLQT